jgi:hypothetical protein
MSDSSTTANRFADVDIMPSLELSERLLACERGFWGFIRTSIMSWRRLQGQDMRLLGAHVVGEQATEVVHIALIARLTESGADLFNRARFNYPTLGDLYK